MSRERKLGLGAAIALVMGNMIGSGIYLLPAGMASYGWISIPAWLVAALGAMLLALMFRKLSAHFPHAQGGPYAYTRLAFGDFAAYLVAWGYWISIWTTNAAIAVALISYLGSIVPALKASEVLQALTAMAFVSILTWVNTRRVTLAGKLQIWTSILKVIPLLLVGIYGVCFLQMDYLMEPLPKGSNFWQTLNGAMVLALFAFLGLESATIPANQIKDAKHLIPKATLIGTLAAIAIYILSSTAVQGLIAPDQLAQSSAPVADAAEKLWGSWTYLPITIGALISAFGALNGWIMLQGQIPAAAADDGVFPKIFTKRNRFGMPVAALITSSILVCAMISLNFSGNLVKTFSFILLLSTLMALLPYLFSAAAGMMMLNTKEGNSKWSAIIYILCFAFVLWAIYGAGQETVFYGFILLLCGIPGYVFLKKNKHEQNKLS